jgi:hypothetical protein
MNARAQPLPLATGMPAMAAGVSKDSRLAVAATNSQERLFRQHDGPKNPLY